MVENLGRIWRSRRKELERERGRILSHNIRDVHASKFIFVPAATFGQLTKHIFDHGRASHPNSNSLCQHGIQHILIFRQKRKAHCSSAGLYENAPVDPRAPLTNMSKDLGKKTVAHHAGLLFVPLNRFALFVGKTGPMWNSWREVVS